ncbi:MAG: endonuclease [Sphingobacteriales bacterium]|nr:endonuclease [Sphingobacteriales bacterium]OJY92339.1 MAG: endonuclease [Sphingobacteriales bacterium 44-15]
MPEGPSIIILKEAVQQFKGKKITDVSENASVDIGSFKGQKVRDIRSWGKQFFICLEKNTIRIHFLLFGSYSINEQTKPDKSLRLGLFFPNGALYFYTCSVKIIQADLDALYDWEADVMSDIWDASRAREKLKAMPGTMVCDALLDQKVFSGVGNIIKNEVLYRIMLHPETRVGKIPPKKISELIRETRNYSFDFLNWKKAYELKKHWLAHTKKTCPRCNLPFIKKYCGKTHRRSFFCENCQVKYD